MRFTVYGLLFFFVWSSTVPVRKGVKKRWGVGRQRWHGGARGAVFTDRNVMYGAGYT